MGLLCRLTATCVTAGRTVAWIVMWGLLVSAPATAGVETGSSAAVLAVLSAPEPPGDADYDRSAWFDAQKARARRVLDGQASDVLVVPFQVAGDGLDQAARSLMTLSLAEGVRQATGLSVADAPLVAQALGLNRRSFTDAEIAGLASDLGARHVLVGAVGQTGPGQFRYRVRISTVRDDETLIDEAAYESGALPLDDVRIPYEHFLATRSQVLAMAFGKSAAARTEPPVRTTEPVPLELDDVLDSDGLTAIAKAHQLQFLAMLLPDEANSLLQQQLYARSLVMLERANPRSGDYTVLRARALLRLHRRPAAVAVLGKARTPAERALLAFANGNSIESVANAGKVEPGLLGLAATLDGERLRLEYFGTPDDRLAELALEQNAVWGALMYRAYGDKYRWRLYSAAPVKLALDQTYPDFGQSLETFIAAQIAVGGAPDEHDFVQLTIRHLDWINKAEKARVRRADPLAAGIHDYTEVLRELLPAEVAAQAHHISADIARPDETLELLDSYEALFRGYPALINQRVKAHSNQYLADRSGPTAANALAGWRDAGRLALRVPGGMNAGNAWMQVYRQSFFDDRTPGDPAAFDRFTYASDWPEFEIGERMDGRPVTDRIETMRHCLAYTVTKIECLTQLHSLLLDQGSEQGIAEAKSLLDEQAARFVGHPSYLDRMAAALTASGDSDGAERLYREAIENGTDNWDAYSRVGTELIRTARYDEALDIALKYPGFNGTSTVAAVALSNEAYEFGSQLYWAGAYEQAKPLFVIATAQPTGSNADMASAQRLALLDGDYEMALYHAGRRVRRYESDYALRDVMGLLVLNGDKAQALNVVNGYQSMLNRPAVWDGVLTVFRADDRPTDEIVDWAFKDGRDDITGIGGTYALRFAFLAYTLDRQVDESLEAMLAVRDDRPSLELLGNTLLERNSRTQQWPKFFKRRNVQREGPNMPSQAILDEMGDLPRKYLQHQEPDRMTRLDELYDYAARGLKNLDAGEFDAAFAEFDEATDFHDLGEFLPYYALAAAKTGQTERIRAYLVASGRSKRHLEQIGAPQYGMWFHDYLAEAALAGGAGDRETALAYLAKANAVVLHNNEMLVYTRYQVIETARRLHDFTGDRQYRDFALDLARRNSTIEPTESYAHSFVAMLSPDRRERVVALARVLVLDPQSRCVGMAEPAELAEARKLAKDRFPPLTTVASDV